MADFSNTIDLWGDGPTLAMILNKTIKTFDDDEVIGIKTGAFMNCKDLTEVNVPLCRSIYNNAFSSCTLLDTVDFPECTTVSTAAFYGCNNLKTISFPKCTRIGYSAFYGCNKLSSASFPVCTAVDFSAFYGCTSLSSISFPRVTSLGNDTFRGCTSLSSVSLPSSLTYLPSGIFYGCTNLRSLSIPGVTSIHSSAFYNCKFSRISLPKCSIPQGFINCTELERVTFGSQPMVTAGYSAFYNCSKLKDIDISALRYLSSGAFYGCKEMASRINSEFSYVLSIGSYALAYTGINKNVFFSRVTSVYDHFVTGNGVTSVDLPACYYVGTSAFAGETSLSSVSLPMCNSLGGSAFYGCTSLSTISLPKVTNIAYSTFYNCTNLKEIDIPGLTGIGGYAFYNTAFSSLSFSKVTTCGEYAFANCTSLSCIDIPKWTSMSSGAFQGCTHLSSLYFPRTLSVISMAYNFSNCYNLSKIEILNPSVSFTSVYSAYASYAWYDMFNNTPFRRGWGKILVPEEAVEYYRSVSYFSTLGDNIIVSNHIPKVCQDLSITHVYPAIGNQTKTKVEYEATCTYEINGVAQPSPEVFVGEDWSDVFNSNIRSEEMERDITFTYLGTTASARMRHLAPLNPPIEISLTEGGLTWYQTDEDDPTLEDYTIFKSPAAKDITSQNAAMKLTFKCAIREYTILVRTDSTYTGNNSYALLRATGVNSTDYNSPYATLNYSERMPGREDLIHYKQITYRNLQPGDYINIRALFYTSEESRVYVALPKYYN